MWLAARLQSRACSRSKRPRTCRRGKFLCQWGVISRRTCVRIEHGPHAEVIDLVEIVVVVAQVVRLAPDVCYLQQAMPRQPLSEGEAVGLGSRLLVILRIQGCDSTRIELRLSGIDLRDLQT